MPHSLSDQKSKEDLSKAMPQSTANSPMPPNTPSTALPQRTNTPTSSLAPSVKLSNAKIGWGMKKNKGAAPEVSSSLAQMLKKYDAYYIGQTNEKVLYLTFDEGYENGYTSQILDTLKSNRVPAAFFITGPYLKKEKELVRRMVEEGHVVGNHTVNHPSMPDISQMKMEDELLLLDRTFKEYFGQDMDYVRPPKGEFSERTLSDTRELGYQTILWSFAYADWDTKTQKGADYAYREVMDYLHPGAIILLHAVSSDNAGALDKIIKDAQGLGYTFKSLDNLSQ